MAAMKKPIRHTELLDLAAGRRSRPQCRGVGAFDVGPATEGRIVTQSGQPRTSALRHTSQLVCFPNESRATAVLPTRLTPPPYSRSPPAPFRLGFEARPAGETGKSRRNSHCVSRPPSRAAYPSKESGVALRHDAFS